MRIGVRGSVALTAAIIVFTIVLCRVAPPPGPAVLTCLVIGILAGALSVAIPSAPSWLPSVASVASVLATLVIGARWGIIRETSMVSLMSVVVSARLSSGLLIGFVRRELR
jgi:hypothetical protein